MTQVRELSDELCQQVLALSDERAGSLHMLQRARLDEILGACAHLQRTVQSYEQAVTAGHSDGPDPRARLMYGGRTTLAIVDLALHLLRLYHARASASLSVEQYALLRRIEKSSRALVQEIERLWAAMQAEHAKPSDGG